MPSAHTQGEAPLTLLGEHPGGQPPTLAVTRPHRSHPRPRPRPFCPRNPFDCLDTTVFLTVFSQIVKNGIPFLIVQ